MPTKLRQFLEIISERFYYSDHDIVILEDLELKEIGLSRSDLSQITSFLKEKGVLLRYNYFDALKRSLLPTKYESKIRVLKNPGFLGSAFPGLAKTWHAFKFSSKQEFLEFYKQDKTDKAPSEFRYDSMNGVLSCGDMVYKIKSKNRRKLFDMLWKHQNELFPKEAMAVQANFIEYSTEFPKVREKFEQEIKDLNRIFVSKKFPLKINTKGGIQLIKQK
jgi:hypothetical protein